MKKIGTSFLLIMQLCIACEKERSFSVETTNTTSPTNAYAKISVNNKWVEYRIATHYENNYAHWCQLWSSPLSTYHKQNACGPTAYMLAAHMIAAAHGYSFMPSSATKLKAIVNNFGSLPAGMNQIASYVNAYDAPPLSTISHTGSNRNGFKAFLESHLGEGNPIIVPIMISTNANVNDSRYTSEIQSANYDLDSSPQSGRPNYVLTTKLHGGYGHFVIVIAIKVNTLTGNGFVYYKDPLANSSTTKICSYARFLESARINGSCEESNCVNYDAIVIKRK